MHYIESYLIPLLGKDMDDPDVNKAIIDLDLGDIDDDPLMGRRYIGANIKGITLLFEENLFYTIQIHVRSSGSYSAFPDTLPFGIKREMSQDEIHTLLGKPKTFDKFDSRYFIENGRVLLIVWYNDSLQVRYLSIGLPF